MGGEYQSAIIVFLLICGIVGIDLWLASRKKDGITPTDWRRVRGMLGIGCVLAVATWFLSTTI